MVKRKVFIFCIVFLCASLSIGSCNFAHTHIGINPSWMPDWSDPGSADGASDSDLTDNDKLWFFSVPPVHPTAPTPGWPNWENGDGGVFLQLVEVHEGGGPILKGDGSGKRLWRCDFMYSESGGYGDSQGLSHVNGFHSAHGPQGAWNLESIDQSTEPQWDIYVKRESTSVAEDDFMMLLPNYSSVLTNDGDSFEMGKRWLDDKNAWGFHEHMSLNFWLSDEIGQEVSVTFSAYDAGGLYQASDDYVMNFVTVPEPGSILFISVGCAVFFRRRS